MTDPSPCTLAYLALVQRSCFDSAASVDPDLTMAELGLDSMAVVDLLVAIEEASGVTVPDEFLTAEVFATPRTLWTVLTGLPGFAL